VSFAAHMRSIEAAELCGNFRRGCSTHDDVEGRRDGEIGCKPFAAGAAPNAGSGAVRRCCRGRGLLAQEEVIRAVLVLVLAISRT